MTRSAAYLNPTPIDCTLDSRSGSADHFDHQLVALLCCSCPNFEHCRWRPTSCSRIGVVSINGTTSADAPRPTPATSRMAAEAPVTPAKPPTDNDWHSAEGGHTEVHRENTQELPVWSQCGGEFVQLPGLGLS